MMKYVRLISSWAAVLALILGSAAFNPFGSFAESKGDDAISESTIEQIFQDRLPRSSSVDEHKLAQHLYSVCRENGLDPAFVLSVIHVESAFRPDVVSPVGAIGLMQLMPPTARVVALRNGITDKITKKTLMDPFLNITLGVTYLRELRDRYAGMSPYFHLAAYNMGPARLDKLRAKPDFRPVGTRKYYETIMKGVNSWRYYDLRSGA